MKIAFIGEAVSGFGGMETVIKNVISELQENCHAECSLFFFCRNDKMDHNWLKGMKHYSSYSGQKISFFKRMKHISNFTSWVKNHKPDIVICFDVISCLYANAARKKSARQYVIYSWPHFSLDHKKHSEYVVYADRHLAISSGIKEQLVARGVQESSIALIYNPVDKKNIIIPPTPMNEEKNFIYIGRIKFEGQKRVKDLLDTFSHINGQWHLHIIGDGSDYAKAQAYAQSLNISSNITWYGWQATPWHLVASKIKTVDALILTSEFEGFPMVLLEALSFGIPCLSSDCVSGPKDMIIDGVNGYLYPLNKLDQLMTTINKLINEEITFCHDNIPSTVEGFYNEIYYKRFNELLLS